MQKKYIKDSKNCYVCSNGTIIGTQGRELKPGMTTTGYYCVVICYKDGSKKSERVHRLVAEAFLPPPSDAQLEENRIMDYKYMTVNHKDGNKLNNDVSNLEWNTYRENNKHAIDTGLNTDRCGELSNFATITDEDVHELCAMLQAGLRNVDIVKLLPKITRSIVDQVRSGLNWKHISEQYSFPSTSRRRSISDSTARWICECLESGMKPAEILRKTTNPLVTRGIIKTIQRRNAYHHVIKDYRF